MKDLPAAEINPVDTEGLRLSVEHLSQQQALAHRLLCLVVFS